MYNLHKVIDTYIIIVLRSAGRLFECLKSQNSLVFSDFIWFLKSVKLFAAVEFLIDLEFIEDPDVLTEKEWL